MKPIGIMFRTGVVVAFAVGVVILFQVLSTEIANRMREYATIKAIGFGTSFVYALGVVQTAFLVLFGFVPAVLISIAVFDQTYVISHLPMRMDGELIAVVLPLTLAMGVASGLITLHRVKRADPAELF